MRTRPYATLATTLAADGWPYVSLVQVACRHDASPLLLISRLAAHTRNIASDARISLLFDGTEGHDDRLSGARVTVLGTARPSDARDDRERFLARHPSAARYVDFDDFMFVHVEVTRARLVAGFGKVEWIDPADLLLVGDHTALREHEADIVSNMNGDHAGLIALYATRLLGKQAGAWHMTGCDAEGCDLALSGMYARLDFDRPIADVDEARARLATLAARARLLRKSTLTNAEGGSHGEKADSKKRPAQAP